MENYVTEKAKTLRGPESSINMANAVVKLADTISELHQMLRIERARADSLTADDFTLKIKNQELEILIENFLGSQKQENKTSLKLREQRNAKSPWEENHECPDGSLSSIGCPTVQPMMQLQKHNMDPNKAYVHPKSSNDKAAEMMQSQWETCLK